ncbi:MAG: hypothetical protein JNJ44_05325 [Zoogloeaceae bacterium]|nr:hypothetical protein [Zoogloeaceae bacterium]
MSRRAPPPPLELDFSGRRPRPGVLGWTLLAIGLGAAGTEILQWRQGEADLADRDAIVERLRREVRRSVEAPVAVGAPQVSVSEQERLPALTLAGRLRADWGAVFQDLDGAEDDRLALLAVEVDGARGLVRLRGEAKSLPAVFDYVAHLEGSPSLGHVQVVGYEMVTIGAVELVQFNAVAQWEGHP